MPPVFLRDPTDTSGALIAYDDEPTAAEARARFGYVPASAAEVEQRTIERQYGDRDAGAFWRAAGAGAFDAAVAPVRLAGVLGAHLVGAEEKDPIGKFASGREFMANVAAVAAELSGQAATAEVAHTHWSEESRNIARANPWASTTGYIAGEIGGGLGLAGASRALGKAAASAAASTALGSTATRQGALAALTEGSAEGATLAVGEAGEQAWIDNERLTSEQLLGAIGWGALLGGGVGGGLYGAGRVARGARDAAGRAGEAIADRYRSVFGGAKVSASADTVAEVGARALGAEPAEGFGKAAKDAAEWVRDRVENAQSVATGADIDTIRKYGGARWDAEAIRGRDLYINRDAIVDSAKGDFNKSLEDLANAAEPVINEYRLAGLKREHVAAHIGEDTAAQIAEARTRAAALDAMVTPLRKPGSAAARTAKAGAEEAIDREAYLATFDAAARDGIDAEIDDEIRETFEALGKEAAEGGRAWKRAEQDVLRERVRGQTPMPSADPTEGSMRGDLTSMSGTLAEVDRFVTRNIDALGKTTDPVEAYMLLDSTKRGLQKYADTVGVFASQTRNPERAYAARALSDHLERFQEPLRKSLENEAVWGRAGTNQRVVNQAFSRYVQSAKLFNGRFMRTEATGYRGLGAVRRAREEATSSFLNKLGLADNASTEQYVRAHMRATGDFLDALDSVLDLGDKKALIGKAREAGSRLTSTMDTLERNVKVANQIKAVIDADSAGAGGTAKTFIGAMLGGPVGAAAGYAADVMTSPGRMMRQAIGVQRVAKRFDVDLEQRLDDFFKRSTPTNDPGPPTTPGARAAGAAAEEGVESGVDDDVFKDEVSGVRERPSPPSVSPGRVAAGAALLGASAASDDAEGGTAGAALAVPVVGRAAVRKAARGLLSGARTAAAHATPSGVLVPIGMRAFMGDHDDKQAAFKARAAEVIDATADMGERVRGVVADRFGEVGADFPGLTHGVTNGLSRAALFLESKLPRSYRAQVPGSPARSTRPVADHDIAKFARYWQAVNDPVSVIHEMALGTMTSEHVEALKAVYPELWTEVSSRLLDRAARHDAAGGQLGAQARQQIARFIGMPVEPAFRKSVLQTLDAARNERAEQAAQQAQGGARKPVTKLGASAMPESQQLAARASGM